MVLKFFQLILNILKVPDNELFVELIEYLKSNHGISNAVAARRIGMSTDKIRNIKRRGSSVSREDINKLVGVFPEIRDRAKELGFDVEIPKVTDPDKQLTSFEQDIEELKELLKTANTDREDIQEQLRKLASVIETQSKIIDKLVDKQDKTD